LNSQKHAKVEQQVTAELTKLVQIKQQEIAKFLSIRHEKQLGRKTLKEPKSH